MIGAMSIRKKRQLQETQVRFFLVILLAILFSSLHNPLDLFSFTSSVFRYYISYILIEVLSDKLIRLVDPFANVAFRRRSAGGLESSIKVECMEITN